MTYLPADSRYDSMQYRRSGRSGLTVTRHHPGSLVQFWRCGFI